MKAWILSDATGNDPNCSLVWADTAGKAKLLAHSSNGYMYQKVLEIEDWRNIRAKRCKYFDDVSTDAKNEKNICLKLIVLFGWYFEIGNTRYSEDNIEEFKELFD